MKKRFYFGIFLALFIGVFFASGVVHTGKYVFKFFQSKTYAIYESESDLGANVISGFGASNNQEIGEEVQYQQTGGSFYHYYPDHEPFPALSSQAYLIADLDTGQLIKQKNRTEAYPIASITKLMTALVSLETLNQEETTFVSQRAINTYGKQGGLYSGQKILVHDLLYPLLLESSNDGAEALAEHSGRNFFMANMNGKAKSIGLENTFFDDPSGLSQHNTSTAEDLFKLFQYLYKNNSEILEITKLKDYENNEQKWFNISDFRIDGNYLGGKNGYTDEAYYTLISSFELPLAENENRRIGIILLKSLETKNDTRSIIRWLLKNVYYE